MEPEEFHEGASVRYARTGPTPRLRGLDGIVESYDRSWVVVRFNRLGESVKCAPIFLERIYHHRPDRCPSNHWNDGADICADCGEVLG